MRNTAAATTNKLKATRVRMFHIEMFCFQSILVASGICNWPRLMDGTSSMLLIGRDCNNVCSKGGIITDKFRAVERSREADLIDISTE